MGAGGSSASATAEEVSILSETHAAILIQNKQRQRVARDRRTTLAAEIRLVQEEVACKKKAKAKKAEESSKRGTASSVIQAKSRQKAAQKKVSALRKTRAEEALVQQKERETEATTKIQAQARQQQAKREAATRLQVRLEGELNSDELLLAAEAGRAELCGLLLAQGHAYPNWRDSSGQTACHYAAANGFPGVLRMLLNLSSSSSSSSNRGVGGGGGGSGVAGGGADPSLVDRAGRTPLGLARDGVARERRALERRLLRKPLLVTKEVLLPTNKGGAGAAAALVAAALAAVEGGAASLRLPTSTTATKWRQRRPETTSAKIMEMSLNAQHVSLSSLPHATNLNFSSKSPPTMSQKRRLSPKVGLERSSVVMAAFDEDDQQRGTRGGDACLGASSIGSSTSTSSTSRRTDSSSSGYAEAVEVLEAQGAKVSQYEADRGLIKAVEVGDLDECRRLVFGASDGTSANPNCVGLSDSVVDLYHGEFPRPDKGPTADTKNSLLPRDRVSSVGKGYRNHTPLHAAALHGQVSACRVLLHEFAADPNNVGGAEEAPSLFGETALHVACFRGEWEVVSSLLSDPRTNPDLVDHCRDTALHAAAKVGSWRCVQALVAGGQGQGGGGPLPTRPLEELKGGGGGGGGGISRGAGGGGGEAAKRKGGGGGGAPSAQLSVKGFRARTPLGLARDGLRAAAAAAAAAASELENNKAGRKAVCKAPARQKKRRGGGSGTETEFALCVEVLERAGAVVCREEANEALFLAAAAGDLAECRHLVECAPGADPSCERCFADETSAALLESKADGWRPLHAACWQGRADVVDYLLYKGADKSALDKRGQTCREVAEARGFEVCARRLRDKTDDDDDDGSGDGGVGGGCWGGGEEGGSGGGSQSRRASRVFGYFGRKGPSAFGFEGLDDVAQGNIGAAAVGGGGGGKGVGNVGGGNGLSVASLDSALKRQALRAAALLSAAKFGDYARAKALLTSPELWGFPTPSRGQQQQQQQQQQPFDDKALASTYQGKSLVQCQAPLFGDSALMLACYRGDKKMVKLLLKHGADVRVADRLLWTPLHYAAFTGTDTAAIELLLKAGADTAAVNSDGRTPAQVARYNRRPLDIVQLIEKPPRSRSKKRDS